MEMVRINKNYAYLTSKKEVIFWDAQDTFYDLLS